MAYGDLTGSRAGRGWGAAPASRSPVAYRRLPKSFRAKYTGRCVECKKAIKVGQMIRRGESGHQHVSCYQK